MRNSEDTAINTPNIKGLTISSYDHKGGFLSMGSGDNFRINETNGTGIFDMRNYSSKKERLE